MISTPEPGNFLYAFAIAKNWRATGTPEKLVATHTLFVVSKDEDCAETVQSMHTAAPGEKSLKVYDGDAHAQFLFKGENADDLTQLITDTLCK